MGSDTSQVMLIVSVVSTVGRALECEEHALRRTCMTLCELVSLVKVHIVGREAEVRVDCEDKSRTLVLVKSQKSSQK